MTRYRTIVADPPWHYPPRPVENPHSAAYEGGALRTAPMPYPTMTTTEISALPVAELAEIDAHLYLWTTSKYLESAYAVARSWGFDPATWRYALRATTMFSRRARLGWQTWGNESLHGGEATA